MTEHQQPVLRLRPYVLITIAHVLLIAAVFALFMGRKPGVFRSQTIVELAPEFYTHISNFSLSYMLYAGIGFVWLVFGVPLRKLAWAGVAMAAANVIYETLIPVLNTRDPVDAAYGVVGTLLAFVWLWVIARFGPALPAKPPGGTTHPPQSSRS